ncbi:MAG: AzlD domain-containing protein [Anaerolineae bacterium]|nr:AzlD domain-containing protein [Anaerolineae bacterium]
MNEYILIGGMMLVTFGVRYPVLALLSKVPLPEPIFRALKYVPPAVLAAIIVPKVLMPSGEELQIHISNAPLIAGTAAVLVAWRSKNLLLTIVLGMLTLWGWQWLIHNGAL